MKKLFITVTLIAVTLAGTSCNKNVALVADGVQMTNLVLRIDGTGDGQVKVTGDQSAASRSIKDIQVLIFDGRTGLLDAVARWDNPDTVYGFSGSDTVRCTAGPRIVCAVANGPRDYTSDASIGDIGDFKAATVTLDDQAADRLTMVGFVEKNLVPGTDAITVPVRRLVCAVSLDSVKNEIEAPFCRDSVHISGAYLMNAPGIQSLDCGIAASSSLSSFDSWRARYARQNEGSSAAILSDSIPDVRIEPGSSYVGPHCFYCFSNDVEAKADGVSKSSSILVVECTVGGVPCVYPIVLPVLEANNRYRVSLTIRHYGGDPDEPWKAVEFTDFTPIVTVSDWTDRNVVEEI